MRKIHYIFGLVFFTCFIFSSSHVSAQFSSIDKSKEIINPGSMAYPFKRLYEKFQVKIYLSNNSKIKLHRKLLFKRLVEIKYLVENKKITPIENATQRFSYQAGVLVEEIDRLDYITEKELVNEEFESYKRYLSIFRDNFPANSSNWLLLQQNIDTLNILSAKLITD